MGLAKVTCGEGSCCGGGVPPLAGLFQHGCPPVLRVPQAAEVLVFGKTLTAGEAYAAGLVAEVFPDSTFQKEVWTRLQAYAKLPKNVE